MLPRIEKKIRFPQKWNTMYPDIHVQNVDLQHFNGEYKEKKYKYTATCLTDIHVHVWPIWHGKIYPSFSRFKTNFQNLMYWINFTKHTLEIANTLKLMSMLIKQVYILLWFRFNSI